MIGFILNIKDSAFTIRFKFDQAYWKQIGNQQY